MPILSKYVIKCNANSKMLVKKSYFIQYLKVFKSLVQTYRITVLYITGNLQAYCTTEQNQVLLKQNWLLCYKSIKTIKLCQSRERKKRGGATTSKKDNRFLLAVFRVIHLFDLSFSKLTINILWRSSSKESMLQSIFCKSSNTSRNMNW